MSLTSPAGAPLTPAPENRDPSATKPSIARRAAEEAKRYLAFAAYLVVVFGTLILFSLNIYARIDQDVPHYSSYHFYALGLINALVLAKFMLVIEATKLGSLSLGRRLQQGPLVYAILNRAALFAAVLTAAYVLEEVLVGAWHGRTISEVLPDIAGGPRGLATFAWVMFVALIPYFAYREIGRALGGNRLHSLLFGTRSA
ncbi:hypothetical protein [Methylobacterium nigriterrae]|uniref:hypothetical protein n=1 Tax=Methylobacterium nigriterrae TaxID=3127512 RepID=UPI003013971F